MFAAFSDGDVGADGCDGEEPVDQGGEELGGLDVVGDEVGAGVYGHVLVGGVPVDEEEGGCGVAVGVAGVAEVAGIAVGLLEPVRQVLAEAGQLSFGTDQ